MLLNAETHHEIEQFLYAEAELLDRHRYSEWIELFTEDCSYWMPVRQTRTAREAEQEFTSRGEIAYFDEDIQSLRRRVTKLESPLAWGESPQPRTRHAYTNIRAISVADDEITVSFNFSFHRSSLETDVDLLVGRREDVLRRVDGTYKFAKRSIFLDQTVIVAKNMNHFF